MASRVLFRLSAGFRDQGCYQQAAQCLLAVLERGGLPTELATAHVLLGRLLLEHFDNLAEARSHILKAVRGRGTRSAQGHLTGCHRRPPLITCAAWPNSCLLPVARSWCFAHWQASTPCSSVRCMMLWPSATS